ncbi:MAG: hypothetical protein KDE55_07335 [Novosphingobium sp.]|nr:hypothetical protein [Novosphingobium sp.]
MGKNSQATWLDVAGHAWLLSAEASMVVPLRLFRLVRGGEAGCREARLMVAEKVEAHGKLAKKLKRGDFGTGAANVTDGVVQFYLGYVRGNRQRLTGRKTGG